MGSGSSKDTKPSSLPAAGSGGRRSRRARVLNYTCFGLPSTLPDDDQNEEENGGMNGKASSGRLEYTSTRNHNERYKKCSNHRQDKFPSLSSSDVEDGEYDRDSTLHTELGAGSSSNDTAVVGQTSNHSGRSHSRFSFIPDRIGSGLGRTVSSGSSSGHCFFPDCLAISTSDGGDLEGIESSVDNQNETSQENVNVQSNSSHDVVTNNTQLQSTTDNCSHRNHTESENGEVRVSNRRFGSQEPLEGSVRFSRTLSVGRLRDRVLRRTSSSAGTFVSALLEDGSLGYVRQANERQPVGDRQRVPSSDRNNEVWPDSSTTHPYRLANLAETSYDNESETPHSRDGSNHDVHRSAFLERRRGIRSQVRALQRLGSRFENLSGHDRSCILSGQHRSGRCTCRANNRAVNPNDDTGTRASISRIVMLAEALFEVLDEIHQQSVALSSRPSFSSIGSVPAPKEVVECMPMKVYMKPKKHLNEELAQCYICLEEYEDGDFVRILPCNHEFHQTCVDKWLKEIHRVCPLCRGDVCRADASGSKKIS